MTNSWLSSTKPKLNLVAAKADLLAAQAEMKKNQIIAEGYDVELAQKNYSRTKGLWEEGLVTKSELDLALGKLEEAQNRQRAATASVAVADLAQRKAGVSQFQRPSIASKRSFPEPRFESGPACCRPVRAAK